MPGAANVIGKSRRNAMSIKLNRRSSHDTQNHARTKASIEIIVPPRAWYQKPSTIKKLV